MGHEFLYASKYGKANKTVFQNSQKGAVRIFGTHGKEGKKEINIHKETWRTRGSEKSKV